MSKQEVESCVEYVKVSAELALHLPDTDGEDDHAGVVHHSLHH